MASERGTDGEKKRKTVGFEAKVESINTSTPNVVKEEEKEESNSSEMSNDEFELLQSEILETQTKLYQLQAKYNARLSETARSGLANSSGPTGEPMN